MSLFTCYALKIKFVPFLRSWHATIPWKKDDKVGRKLLIKKKGKAKKREREPQRKIEWRKKKLNFGLCASMKTKKLFNYVRLVGKYAFFDAKFIFSHSLSHANQTKTSPKKRSWSKLRFFRYLPAVTKGLKKVTNLFQIGLSLIKQSNLPISARNRFVM